MMHFYKRIRSMKGDRRGATAVEYAMIIGLVAIASLATLSTLGNNINSMFKTISDKLTPPKATP